MAAAAWSSWKVRLLRDIRPTDEIEVLVITESKINGQTMADFPIVLEVEAKLLRVLDDERGIADRDAHAVLSIAATSPGVAKPAATPESCWANR